LAGHAEDSLADAARAALEDGRPDAALEMFDRILGDREHAQTFHDAAGVCLHLGEPDRAVAMLWNARAQGSHDVAAPAAEPLFAPIVDDPRRREVFEDIDLATGAWVAGLHRHRMARLRAAPAPRTAEVEKYIRRLAGGIATFRRCGATHFAELDGEIAEVAAYRARPPANTAGSCSVTATSTTVHSVLKTCGR
jgi:hypothetical protein